MGNSVLALTAIRTATEYHISHCPRPEGWTCRASRMAAAPVNGLWVGKGGADVCSTCNAGSPLIDPERPSEKQFHSVNHVPHYGGRGSPCRGTGSRPRGILAGNGRACWRRTGTRRSREMARSRLPPWPTSRSCARRARLGAPVNAGRRDPDRVTPGAC